MYPVFFNPVLILLLSSPINTREISKSPQVRFLLVWSSLNYLPVHQPAVTNSMHLQSPSTPHLQQILSEAHLESSRTSQWSLIADTVKVLRPSWMFNRILNAILPNNSLHLHQTLATFPGMFGDIPRHVWQHSLECLATFPRMFGDIPWNVWRHSPECLTTFPGMFGNIPRNVWGYSPECLATFTEYNIPPFPAFLAFRSPFLYFRFYA